MTYSAKTAISIIRETPKTSNRRAGESAPLYKSWLRAHGRGLTFSTAKTADIENKYLRREVRSCERMHGLRCVGILRLRCGIRAGGGKLRRQREIVDIANRQIMSYDDASKHWKSLLAAKGSGLVSA